MARALALLLTLLTGFTGLVYEVVWQRSLATLLGSHSEATAAVLGIFLGGLSLGYALFGRVTRAAEDRARAAGRPPRLLLLYGVVEGTIGVLALAFPWLFGAVQALSFAVPHGAGGAGFAFDVGLTALLIGPPTVLMGGTIPILTQALSRGLEDATRFHAFVYASNTVGAFAGALAAAFVLVPSLGLEATARAMGALNLAAGAVFVVLGLRGGIAGDVARDRPAAAPDAAGRSTLPFVGVALLAGFSMMALQAALNRIGALGFGASQFTFAMVVAVFVLCIALGSFTVSLLPRIPSALVVITQWALAACLVLLYQQVENVPWAVHALRSVFRDDPSSFHPYWAAAFLSMLLVLVVPIGLSGALLPLLFHQLRREPVDLGAMAGRLYAWNTVGSLLGALVGGYLLLAWLDLHHVFRVAIAGVAISATILTWRVLGRSPLACGGVLIVALAGVALLPAWRPERFAAGAFRVREPTPHTFLGPGSFYPYVNARVTTEFHDDDPIATVTVKRYETGAALARGIATNGKIDGNIPGDNPTMALLAVLPSLFSARAESAFVIGYGTGMTAGVLASLPEMKRVVVAEISPAVVAAAPLFDFGNFGARQSPQLEIVHGDAYRTLLRSDERYDVIVSEPSNPWVVGVEMLFSREFLEAAKSRLAPGGVYAQWFHVYETDAATIETVLRTYASVFPRVAIWYGLAPDLVLLGWPDPKAETDLATLERRFSEPAIQAALRASQVRALPALLAHELLPAGALHAMPLPGDVHTLLRPVLSDRAARAFFVGANGRLPAPGAGAKEAVDASMFRALAARSGGTLPDAERAIFVREVCATRSEECAVHLAAWTRDAPDSPALRDLRATMRPTGDAPFEGLRPENQERLLRLLGGGAPVPGSMPLGELRTLTAMYDRYFTAAVPFDAKRLASLWERCSDPAGRCIDEADAVRKRLGR